MCSTSGVGGCVGWDPENTISHADAEAAIANPRRRSLRPDGLTTICWKSLGSDATDRLCCVLQGMRRRPGSSKAASGSWQRARTPRIEDAACGKDPRPDSPHPAEQRRLEYPHSHNYLSSDTRRRSRAGEKTKVAIPGAGSLYLSEAWVCGGASRSL